VKTEPSLSCCKSKLSKTLILALVSHKFNSPTLVLASINFALLIRFLAA